MRLQVAACILLLLLSSSYVLAQGQHDSEMPAHALALCNHRLLLVNVRPIRIVPC